MSDAATGAPAPAAPAPAAAAPAATTLINETPAATPPADGAPDPAANNGEAGGEVVKTPEQIEADRVAAEKADGKKDGEKAQGAPEKYEAFKAPEGAALDDAVMTKFSEAAREMNLSQDQAQKLVDQMAPVMAARQAEQIQAFSDEWVTASKADKEFGGDKLADSMVHAKRALDTFATPELRTILDQSKLGNHPELVRFMVRAGKAISEDKIVMGGTPASTANRSAADVLYGGSKPK